MDKKAATSKRLTWFAGIIYAATWIVVVVSWFILQEIPVELIQYSTLFCLPVFGAYYGKAAYENKYKIIESNKKPTKKGAKKDEQTI